MLFVVAWPVFSQSVTTNPSPPKQKDPAPSSLGSNTPLDIDKWEWVATSINAGETVVPIYIFENDRRKDAGSIPIGTILPMKLQRRFYRRIYYGLPNPALVGKVGLAPGSDLAWIDGIFIQVKGPAAPPKVP